MLLIWSAIWAGAVAVLLGRAWQQYRGYIAVSAGPDSTGRKLAEVTVIIPARNEEQNIDRCLQAVLQQDYPASRFRVIVVDDNSTDDTAAIIRTLAGFDERVQLLPSGDLPPDWTGKPHACWKGALAATGEWLCFLDADVIAAPALLRVAVSQAESSGIDLLSLEPFQELGSFAERLIIPAGLFLIAFTRDLRRVNDPAAPEAAANGQFILVRRDVYLNVGGHAAVGAEICEDSALARAIKHSGKRIFLMGAEKLARVRMYHGLRPLWEGFSRNAVEIAGGPAAAIAFSLGALVLGWMAPALPLTALILLAREPFAWPRVWALVFGGASSLALLGMHIGGARHFRIAWWHGLLFPLGYTLAALIGLNSVWIKWRGRVAWKGRVYDAPNRSIAAVGR